MFERLLEAIALGLDSRGIPYMVVGGQAVLLYGEPRLTRDIDVTLGVGPDRLPEIMNLAQGLAWQILARSPDDFVRESLVLPCLDAASGIRVDFIFSFSPYERQAMDRVRKVLVGSQKVRFAAVEDLIIHKMLAGRPRDLEDVRAILLKRPPIDMDYLGQWLEEFDRGLQRSLTREFDQLRLSSTLPSSSEHLQ